jgi:hypothetical protein
VPEGDEETGITDVGIVINQGGARHSFIIQTPFELDVTATSATLPTTKFVVSKLDIVPGYGQNTYGDLQIVSTGGVYGDDFGSTPISVLQDVRFNDLYSENPAYQSILNLFIDNTIDVSTLSTTTRLKYETFAVSGTIPILESIVTTESLTIKPEIPIILQVNDVSVISFTEMNRELPVLIAETSTLTASKEYKLSGHATRLRKYGSILLSEYESVLISAVADVTFDDFIQSASSLADMNVEADFIFSTVAPQKFASAQNLVYLYRIDLGDVSIAEVVDETFTDLLPQSLYEGTSTAYETSTFESIYTVQPKQYQEYIKVLPVTSTELNNLSVNREVVVRSEGNGFRYVLYDDLLLSDYETSPISTLSDITFDTNLDITVHDVTIKATTSPYTGGQSARRNPTDIFRNETRVDIQSASDGYALPYGDLPISALADYAISGTLYDIPLSGETFGTTYPSLYTASKYTKYEKIVGTVSSANAGFSTLPLSTFSTTAIDVVDDSLLSDLVPIVIGSGTDFSNESLPLGFAVGGVFVANNEYFIVESIANTTYMTTDRLPASSFSGVVAYRIPA